MLATNVKQDIANLDEILFRYQEIDVSHVSLKGLVVEPACYDKAFHHGPIHPAVVQRMGALAADDFITCEPPEDLSHLIIRFSGCGGSESSMVPG